MNQSNNLTGRDLLVQVASMKYKLDMTQSEIAKALGFSTMQVSRLLSRAKEEGVVKIEVDTGTATDSALAERLKERYCLDDAVVVKTLGDDDITGKVISAAVFYIDLIVRPGDVIGLGGGRTEMKIIPGLRLPAIKEGKELKVVQLAGGFLNINSQNPFSLIYSISSRFGAKGVFLPTPFYAPSIEALTALEKGSLSGVREEWRRCTVNVGGIGTIGPDSLLYNEGAISHEQMEYLLSKGAVGNLLGRWYDSEGEFIDCDLNRCATSIEPELFEKIRTRVLVAYEREKIAAIRAAMKRRLYNVFVTTDSIAEELLDGKA